MRDRQRRRKGGDVAYATKMAAALSGATISQLHHWRNLITRDRAQFSDPRECDAIKKSGLHHVRYAQRPGSRGLALALGAIIAAMPMVMEELETATAQACR
jgi:hypothetical protein